MRLTLGEAPEPAAELDALRDSGPALRESFWSASSRALARAQGDFVVWLACAYDGA